MVIALVAGAVVWLWPDDDPSSLPFPEIGFVTAGERVPHTVLHRTATPNIDEATISFAGEETSTWDGSLSFGDAKAGDYDAEEQ